MSRRGDCWHNAVTESFFAPSQKLSNGNLLVSREHAANAVAGHIKNYYTTHITLAPSQLATRPLAAGQPDVTHTIERTDTYYNAHTLNVAWTM